MSEFVFNFPQLRSYGDKATAKSHSTDLSSWDQTWDQWVQGQWFIHYTTLAHKMKVSKGAKIRNRYNQVPQISKSDFN